MVEEEHYKEAAEEAVATQEGWEVRTKTTITGLFNSGSWSWAELEAVFTVYLQAKRNLPACPFSNASRKDSQLLSPIKQNKPFTLTICPDTVVTFLLPFGLPRGFFTGNGPTASSWDKRRKSFKQDDPWNNLQLFILTCFRLSYTNNSTQTTKYLVVSAFPAVKCI